MAIASMCEIELHGQSDDALSASELSSLLAPSPHNSCAVAVALDDQSVVGYSTMWTPLRDNLDLAELNLQVQPQSRRQGIGTQLWDWAQQLADEQGRHLRHVYVTAPIPGLMEPVITAPTGDVFPANHPGAQFVTQRGFTLEQVEIETMLDLPLDVTDLHQQALKQASGYAIHTWRTPLPDAWVAGFAALRTQVTSDVPSAGLAVERQIWDSERLRHSWEQNAIWGRHTLVTAAEDLITGELVGFSQVVWQDEKPECVQQGYTFVRQDHRGHRLGMLLKTTMINQLAAQCPQIKRVYTDNAGENDHMRSINRALGFQLHALFGVFQLRKD